MLEMWQDWSPDYFFPEKKASGIPVPVHQNPSLSGTDSSAAPTKGMPAADTGVTKPSANPLLGTFLNLRPLLIYGRPLVK